MSSITNAELKHIKSLHTKKGRKSSKKFLAEGVRVLEEAIRARFLPRRLYVADSMLSDRGRALVSRMQSRNVEVTDIPSQKLEALAETKSPQGLVAIFDRPHLSLSEHYRTNYRRVLWCENINDPGNLGTLMRSAAAFGFKLVCLAGDCAEPYAPKVVRSSAGQIFYLQVAEVTFDDMSELTRDGRMKLLSTSARGETSPGGMKQTVGKNGVIVAVGGESSGLSSELVQASDFVVRIPHEKAVESLNVAVAGSIMMKLVYDIQEPI